MLRTVTITLQVDATEYNEAVDTPTGTIDLVIDMLRGEADLPDEVTMSCEGISRKTGDHF